MESSPSLNTYVTLKVGFADGEWHKVVVFKSAGGGETSLVVDRVLRASSEMHRNSRSRSSREERLKQQQKQHQQVSTPVEHSCGAAALP